MFDCLEGWACFGQIGCIETGTRDCKFKKCRPGNVGKHANIKSIGGLSVNNFFVEYASILSNSSTIQVHYKKYMGL